ncbi:hypothetical protein F2Q69_00013999 [Brassica cretica]|uniref:Uncharacterized protein n=1 Tax=Brassica cretica TaxID=69181 RepID=A0A8S9QJA7_BRACR|nr:hypothetical protein F2Q69_00013999 [Brassica cretica]
MKLIWSPETASKAYIDTVKSVKVISSVHQCEKLGTPGAAELVAAMAAGWNATLIVETWSEGAEAVTGEARGLEIAHVAAARISGKSDNNNKRKWIKHIDQRSGEEHVIRNRLYEARGRQRD